MLAEDEQKAFLLTSSEIHNTEERKQQYTVQGQVDFFPDQK